MIYILLADGFEEMEALIPYDILKRGGQDVNFVSCSQNLEVEGSHGVKFTADILFKDIDLKILEMLIIPGGKLGTFNIDSHVGIDELLRYSAKNNKYIAAICAGPLVLGKRGYLRNRRAVCYPGFEKFLLGAEIQNSRVVRDERFITAIGAGAAFEFAYELLKLISNKNTAEDVRLSIC